MNTTSWTASVNGTRIPVITACRSYIYHHGIAFLVINDIGQYMPPLCKSIERHTVMTQEVMAVIDFASIRILVDKNARPFLCGQHHEI